MLYISFDVNFCALHIQSLNGIARQYYSPKGYWEGSGVIRKYAAKVSEGGEIRDTKALNLSLNIVSLLVLGRCFAWSTCHTTKTFVASWRNAACWFVDLPGVDPSQVASLVTNEQQSLNLLLKVVPRSTFRSNFPQPAIDVFVARQVDHARWKTRNIDPKRAAKQCC